jgi:hypothetical protein
MYVHCQINKMIGLSIQCYFQKNRMSLSYTFLILYEVYKPEIFNINHLKIIYELNVDWDF